MERGRPAVRALAVAALVVVVQAVLVTLFSWPASRLAPRDLPVVVAGPAPAAAAFADRLRTGRPGAFDVEVVAGAPEADDALRHRRAYAAFVLGPAGPSLHVASAAGPVVSQLITQAAQEMSPQGRPVAVTDVVPADPDDPRGSGFAAGFLPLVLTSLMVGVLLAVAVPGRLARLLGVVVFAGLAGLVGTAILQGGLGVLPGPYLADAGVVALLALAMSGTVVGLASALGYPGLGLAALVMLAVGNPLSGVTAAPELLPRPWGEVGQWLPPGAGATLLRATAFFDGAGGARAALVLVCWAAAGSALTLSARRRITLPGR